MASNSTPTGSNASAPTVATYGAIHTSTADLWMIRLPHRLATAWEDVPEGTDLGTLTFTKGGGGPAKRTKLGPTTASKLSITIDSKLGEAQMDLPLSYTLEAVTKKTPGALHPFTRNPDGGVSVHGIVSRTASAQVAGSTSGKRASSGAGDDRYKTLLRNRLLDTAVNTKRFVRPGGLNVSSGPGGGGRASAAATAAASLGTGFGGSVAKFGKRLMDAQERVAQERTGVGFPIATGADAGPPITGAESIRSTLFEFFSKKRLWTIRELRQSSGGRLPDRETRDVLREIAEYHRAGENKNMWELKAEFRSAATTAAASSNGGGDQSGKRDRNDNDDNFYLDLFLTSFKHCFIRLCVL